MKFAAEKYMAHASAGLKLCHVYQSHHSSRKTMPSERTLCLLFKALARSDIGRTLQCEDGKRLRVELEQEGAVRPPPNSMFFSEDLCKGNELHHRASSSFASRPITTDQQS